METPAFGNLVGNPHGNRPHGRPGMDGRRILEFFADRFNACELALGDSDET
jgi:hypothetical protein